MASHGGRVADQDEGASPCPDVGAHGVQLVGAAMRYDELAHIAPFSSSAQRYL